MEDTLKCKHEPRHKIDSPLEDVKRSAAVLALLILQHFNMRLIVQVSLRCSGQFLEQLGLTCLLGSFANQYKSSSREAMRTAPLLPIGEFRSCVGPCDIFSGTPLHLGSKVPKRQVSLVDNNKKIID